MTLTLPPRIGPFSVVRSIGTNAENRRFLVRCELGHETWRSSLTTKKGRAATLTCAVCLSDKQLDALAAVYAHGLLYGCGPTQRELDELLGRQTKSLVAVLVTRGFVELDPTWGEWRVTPEGIAEIERERVIAGSEAAAE